MFEKEANEAFLKYENLLAKCCDVKISEEKSGFDAATAPS